ncbi:hypothetical protein AAVH_23578 [Aphelenchoides avenae]|nr:hypothetical protein AAVH_23578 [Aphelenchus avenae]
MRLITSVEVSSFRLASALFSQLYLRKMDQDPKTQLALLSAKHGCLRKQLDEANVKVTELTAEVIQLKDHNKKLQEDSAELKVYREVIEPGLHRKCKEDEEKLAATEAKLRDTESKLRDEQAKVQKLYRREKLMATNQVANVQMSSVKHEAVSVIQHSATAALDPPAQTGPPEDNDATTGPRIASPSVSTSNDAPRPPSGTAPSAANSRVEQSSAQRPDSTQQLMNVPVNVTEVGSAAGDITNAEDENLIADASRPQSPVLGPPRGVLEIEREEEEDMKRSEVQEELELNTTQELAVSSTTGAQSPATSKKRGRAQEPSARSTVPRKRKAVERIWRSSSRVSAHSDAQPVGEHAGSSSPSKPGKYSQAFLDVGKGQVEGDWETAA